MNKMKIVARDIGECYEVRKSYSFYRVDKKDVEIIERAPL